MKVCSKWVLPTKIFAPQNLMVKYLQKQGGDYSSPHFVRRVLP